MQKTLHKTFEDAGGGIRQKGREAKGGPRNSRGQERLNHINFQSIKICKPRKERYKRGVREEVDWTTH